MEQMGLRGKKRDTTQKEIGVGGKMGWKDSWGVFLSELGHFLDLNKWGVSFAILRDFCPF